MNFNPNLVIITPLSFPFDNNACFFYLWVSLYPYVHILYLLYPFICHGHLGGFHVLVILNSAAMNIEVHIFFSNHTFPLIYVKEWDLQDHMEVHFLTFKEPPYCSPWWLHQFTFLKEGCFFSTSSPVFIICRHFDDGYSYRCEVLPHYNFDLHFSNY